QPRQFVPAEIDLGDWSKIEPLFLRLEDAAPALKSPGALQKWVMHGSELAAALDEEGAKRYINYTCQTDDPANEKAYLHFIEEIEPKSKPHWHKLKELFIASPHCEKLPLKRWMVFKRATRNDIEMFRVENIPLQVQEAKL